MDKINRKPAGKAFGLRGYVCCAAVKFFNCRRLLKLKLRLTSRQKQVVKRILFPAALKVQDQVEKTRCRLLNLGFTERALQELHYLAAGNGNAVLKRLAARELALWYANQRSEDGARHCLEMLPLARMGENNPDYLRQAAVLEAECRSMLGDTQGGKRVLSRAIAFEPHADLYLAASNLELSTDERVNYINKALELSKISPIKLETSVKGPLFDRLTSSNTLRKIYESKDAVPMVTVIMPAYNAESTIQTALRSVLNQTWTNLEVLVVDDCSTDGTAAIVEDYMAGDPRVKLIKNDSNSGPYVARNQALREASGVFVTCSDADDWSHPEKIERQVMHLLQKRSAIGNTSHQARVTAEMQFYRRGNYGVLIFENMSSLMFRRKAVLDAAGFWDCVRFGADNEFIRRLRKVFGKDSVLCLEASPLSFTKQSGDSLTGNRIFGYDGYYMGARKEYFESFSCFHAASCSLRFEFPQGNRPFAVPELMRPGRETQSPVCRQFNVILVSDFRIPGDVYRSNVDAIIKHKRLGRRIGLIQLYTYEFDPGKEILPGIRKFLDGEQVQMLVYGEKASCDWLIVIHPPVLRERQRFIPDVRPKKIILFNDRPTGQDSYTGGAEYSIDCCAKNLREYFGRDGFWLPCGRSGRGSTVFHNAEIG